MTKFDSYGGQWTMKKLEALRSYLGMYLTALQDQQFKLLYIDAFAGPGLWKQNDKNFNEPSLYGPEDFEYQKGSPLIALEAMSSNKGSKRTFDKFYFIDNNKDYIENLQSVVREKHENKSDKVSFIQGEANFEVLKLCNTIDWKSSRAVIFLDPFGMEVKWQTIKAIAKTESMDLWVLFPLGVAVNRMLTIDGDIPPLWKEKLDVLFGTIDWRTDFYKTETPPQLLPFDDIKTPNLQKIASFEKIAGYFIKRLKTVFAGVIEEPMMLKNSKGNPLFSLCFAAGNKKGSPIAIRLAKHIIAKKP